ncbi:MAG: hypothetical protein GXP08_18445 [Gammaproteobacteria bacterium]|nr:hypothetical protein [Gammaproteobacteria bacterium]
MTGRRSGANRNNKKTARSQGTHQNGLATPASIRIDKWLWAARFFKTRSLASDAVKSGKICIDDEKTKPSKEITIGKKISIKRSPYNKTVIVRGISHRRGPASIAETLYEETLDSIQNRQHLEQLRQAQPALRHTGHGRPTKRERRQIIAFTAKPEE